MKRKQGPITSSSQTKKTKVSKAVVLLQDLLDFSRGVKTEEDIERRFKHIAVTLLHEFHLVVVQRDEDTTKEIEFEILEAEFYLLIGGHYEDPFAHWNGEQKISGQWCVVRYCFIFWTELPLVIGISIVHREKQSTRTAVPPVLQDTEAVLARV